MLKTVQTTNINGQSVVKEDGAEVVVAYLNATIGENGVQISKNISNQTLYKANIEEVRKDMNDFETLAFEVQEDNA